MDYALEGGHLQQAAADDVPSLRALKLFYPTLLFANYLPILFQKPSFRRICPQY
jgi:hypothetical protein